MSILNNASINSVGVEILEINRPYPILCAANVIRESGSMSLLKSILLAHNHIVKIHLRGLFNVTDDLLPIINDGSRKYNLTYLGKYWNDSHSFLLKPY